MSRLDPKKLTVDFKEGVTEKAPIIPRRYTLTHSDNTGDLFLTIGPNFVFDKVTATRDEVLGEWILDNGIRYIVYLHVGLAYGQDLEHIRDYIFRRELPLALEAIRYGDRIFFDSHPEMDQYPILIYFLYNNPEYNIVEYWGTFADYDIKRSRNHVKTNSIVENHILIDERIGDVNGDGIPDRVSMYGDKLPSSDLIHSIILEIYDKQTSITADMITELNAYNPTLFLGDFTKDQVDDILFRADLMFNSMNSKDKGEYGIGIHTIKENQIETIFASDRYNDEYRFLVEYNDFYKISILSVIANRIFVLDISYKGKDYLSKYYSESGELIRPVQGEVLKAEAFIPVISNKIDNSYDLLAIHRIIGSTISDTLGYIDNLLSWNGARFISINMLASTPGTELIQSINNEN